MKKIFIVLLIITLFLITGDICANNRRKKVLQISDIKSIITTAMSISQSVDTESLIQSIGNQYQNQADNITTTPVSLPSMIKAIASHESNLNVYDYKYENRVSDFSLGFMQVRIKTARGYLPLISGFTSDDVSKMSDSDVALVLFNAQTNIIIGTLYFLDCLRAFPDDLMTAVRAYNLGTTGVLTSTKYNYGIAVMYNYNKYVGNPIPIIPPFAVLKSKEFLFSPPVIISTVILAGMSIWLFIKFKHSRRK